MRRVGLRGAVLAVLLLALAPTVAAAQDPCDGADILLSQKNYTEAQHQYRIVLGNDPQATCAVEGLSTIAEVEKKAADDKKADDETLDRHEVWESFKKFLRTQAWPWIALAVVLWLAAAAFRTAFESNRVSVRAPKPDEALGTAVAAAADAAGGSMSSPVKVVTGGQDPLPVAGADLSKLLRIPGTGPLPDLFNLSGAIPRRKPDLYVSSAMAGGWAVLELELRQNLTRTKTARITVAVGGADEKDVQAGLALTGAAWLIASLDRGDHKPVTPSDDHPGDAAVGYGCFRAGAAMQSSGKLDLARAFYDAMPPRMGPSEAPSAWMGVRLNEMMALKDEGRWHDAIRLARKVTPHPGPAELRPRRAYMLAIVWTDLVQAGKADSKTLGFTADEWKAVLADAAAAARVVAAAAAPLRASDDPQDRSLAIAMELVVLCHSLLSDDGGPSSLAEVKSILASAAGVDTVRPLLHSAPYFDAACAISLMIRRGGLGAQRATYRQEGLRMLRFAMAATNELRRPRIRASALSDPMLKTLRDADLAAFKKAIGADAPAATAASGSSAKAAS